MPAPSKVYSHFLTSPLLYSLLTLVFTSLAVGQENQPLPPIPSLPGGEPKFPNPDNYCEPVDYLIDSLKPLAAIDLGSAKLDPADVPEDCSSQRQPDSNQPFASSGRRFEKDQIVHWQPSMLAHRPLYFEDVALERYGQGYSPMVQPFVSGGKFAFSTFSLPYRMALDHPNSYFYTLGYERPGDWAPSVVEQLPWNWRAAFVQASAVTGGALIYP